MDIRAWRNIIERPQASRQPKSGPVGAVAFETSAAIFALLFASIVKSCHNSSSGIDEMESRLALLGREVGLRLHLALALREKPLKRETRLINALYYVYNTYYKYAFGRAADSLERSNDSPDEYMIIDNDPCVGRYVSVPRELQHFNSNSFIAGMLEAVLCALGFNVSATAHSQPTDRQPMRTVFLLRFDSSINERENATPT